MLVLESHLGLITEGQFPIWGQAEDIVHTWELIYRVWPGCWGPRGSLIFPSSGLDKSRGTMALSYVSQYSVQPKYGRFSHKIPQHSSLAVRPSQPHKYCPAPCVVTGCHHDGPATGPPLSCKIKNKK